jgi:hypothetical protein
MTSGNEIAAYTFGITSNPLLEFDVELSPKAPFRKSDLDALLGTTTNFRYLSIQSQVDSPTSDFVAKLSMAQGYDLENGRGRVLTRLSEVVLERNKLEHLQILPLLEKDAVFLHITVFG